MNYFFDFFLIAVIAAFTPGPNNAMLLQSSMAFGFNRTLRHMFGIIYGFATLFLAVYLGLHIVFEYYPKSLFVFKIVASVYFLFLAYKMLHIAFTYQPQATHEVSETLQSAHNTLDNITPQSSTQKKKATPWTSWQAALFQLVNVKAWFFSISAISTLPKSQTFIEGIITIAIIILVTVLSASSWMLFGIVITRLFKNRISLCIIQTLLALSLVYITFAQWF